MAKKERLLWQASKVWCPDVGKKNPRRASTRFSYQEKATSRIELVSKLIQAAEGGKAGYVSTYSFPRGHTDDGNNIPKVDTIFVDFDVPQDSEYRTGESRTLDEWKRSMSDLLVRVQMVAEQILESGKATHWRAALSGHKGVHLFFDFEPIHPANGTYSQFKNGLKAYGDGMIDQLAEIAGGVNINPWVDVDSSDLARLVRHPNTPHFGAEHRDDELSWCVPISIEELAELTPDDYLELTSGPRECPYDGRNPSKEATEEISVKIRNAKGAGAIGDRGSGTKDPHAVKEYKENSNEKITVGDLPLLVSNKPCIMEFIARDDSYDYGKQSRVMEIQIMKELIQKEVPISTIVNFFRPIDGFDEAYTRRLVEDLISRYNGPFCCTNIWEDAQEFCIAMTNQQKCSVYDRAQAAKTIA